MNPLLLDILLQVLFILIGKVFLMDDSKYIESLLDHDLFLLPADLILVNTILQCLVRHHYFLIFYLLKTLNHFLDVLFYLEHLLGVATFLEFHKFLVNNSVNHNCKAFVDPVFFHHDVA